MGHPKHIAILGSTGSIGRSSLEVIARFPDRFRVRYLTAHRNVDLLAQQIRRFHPRGVVVHEQASVSLIRELIDGSTEVLTGEEGLCEVVSRNDVDTVLSSLVGFAGLRPTYAAVDAGKDVALANKEALVVGGSIIMSKAMERGVRILPVDSEHSAILQCLQGENLDSVARLSLTASGGPFRERDARELAEVTKEEALTHPTWRMGKKITIDSATLMNKGLEVIEDFWLFGLPPERIEVIIHPQSIIHSMVEFVDGSMKAQLGIPDMKIPIQYALTYPERLPAPHQRIDFSALRQMTFSQPDTRKFRCLPLAYEALRTGGSAPTVLNAANEVAVSLFLEERIPLTTIPDIIQDALSAHRSTPAPTLDDLVRIDRDTRESVFHQHTVPG
ncbi:MAG: 1-deoxy-D-xylulose-5-phosphate reductoisomerase [Bacteroidota bacterium]